MRRTDVIVSANRSCTPCTYSVEIDISYVRGDKRTRELEAVHDFTIIFKADDSKTLQDAIFDALPDEVSDLAMH